MLHRRASEVVALSMPVSLIRRARNGSRMSPRVRAAREKNEKNKKKRKKKKKKTEKNKYKTQKWFALLQQRRSGGGCSQLSPEVFCPASSTSTIITCHIVSHRTVASISVSMPYHITSHHIIISYHHPRHRHRHCCRPTQTGPCRFGVARARMHHGSRRPSRPEPPRREGQQQGDSPGMIILQCQLMLLAS